MPRRILEGEVVSDKMHKTITVRVTRRYMHPVYKKYLRKSDKFAAHDENNHYKVGDKVQIIECRPISKNKRWLAIVNGVTELPAPNKKFSTPDAGKQATKKAPVKGEKTEKAGAKKPAAKSAKGKKA